MSFAVGPNDLKQKPTITPNKIPIMTWKLRLVKSFFMQNKYTLIRQIIKGLITLLNSIQKKTYNYKCKVSVHPEVLVPVNGRTLDNASAA